MALVEEELPGVNKGEWLIVQSLLGNGTLCTNSQHLLHLSFFVCAVRSDFRVREDSAIAHKLQEQECKNTVLHIHDMIYLCYVLLKGYLVHVVCRCEIPNDN